MSSAPFHYSGPITIGGVAYPAAQLNENPRERGLRSWGGTLYFDTADQPDGFSPSVVDAGPVQLELPDGRTGQALTSLSFDGAGWTIDLVGTGPTPS